MDKNRLALAVNSQYTCPDAQNRHRRRGDGPRPQMGGGAGVVLLLVAHHFYLGKLIRDFKADRNKHGHVFYRWLNEIPVLPALIGIVILVVVKPF